MRFSVGPIVTIHSMRKLAAIYLIALTAAFAQGTTSRVTGTVQDPAGAMVANASVKLINQANGVTFSSSTTSAGTYVFEAVQPGQYEVQADAPGFSHFVSRNNAVSVSQPATVNVVLT